MAREAGKALSKRIEDLLANSEGVDDRLDEGMLHACVVATLGKEPIVFVADILRLTENVHSKMRLQPGEAVRTALALHDRLYGNEVLKKPKKKTNEELAFQLDFGWSNLGENENEGQPTQSDTVT
jgi:hypothetical protein